MWKSRRRDLSDGGHRGYRSEVAWIFAIAGAACGTSTFAFITSRLYQGFLAFSLGMFWSVFFCLALGASLAMTGLVLGPRPWRILLGAVAPAVGYPAAMLSAALSSSLGDWVGLNAYEGRVFFVASPLLVFTASIIVMLRVWSNRVGTRACVELAMAWLITVFGVSVLERFDRPALAVPPLQLLFVASVTILFFVGAGRSAVGTGVVIASL
jgi:hypothetical protein